MVTLKERGKNEDTVEKALSLKSCLKPKTENSPGLTVIDLTHLLLVHS